MTIFFPASRPVGVMCVRSTSISGQRLSIISISGRAAFVSPRLTACTHTRGRLVRGGKVPQAKRSSQNFLYAGCLRERHMR